MNFIKKNIIALLVGLGLITGGGGALGAIYVPSKIVNLTTANFATNTVSQWYNDAGYVTSTLGAEVDPIWLASSSAYLTISEASSTYLTTSTGLTVNNFASSNISQWTNDLGYVTSTSGGDSLWTKSGNDIYYADGNVGIGTTEPENRLEVKGNVSPLPSPIIEPIQWVFTPSTEQTNWIDCSVAATHTYKIYTYNNVAGVKYYSSSSTDAIVAIPGQGEATYCSIDLTWEAPEQPVDGYKIVYWFGEETPVGGTTVLMPQHTTYDNQEFTQYSTVTPNSFGYPTFNVDFSGNISINTSTDDRYALNVNGDVNFLSSLLFNGTRGNSTQVLRLDSNLTPYWSDFLEISPPGADGSILVGDTANNTWSEVQSIFIDKNTGYMGIGTTTPATALDIVGELTVRTGGSASHATCWKADGVTIGYCSSVVAADGTCTCN